MGLVTGLERGFEVCVREWKKGREGEEPDDDNGYEIGNKDEIGV